MKIALIGMSKPTNKIKMNTIIDPVVKNFTTEDFQNYFRKAEETKDPVDLYNLGCCYNYGFGTSPDFEKAAECYKKAIAGNCKEAEYNLGLLYLSGRISKEDTFKTMDLIERSANKGLVQAMTLLSTVYLSENSFQDIRYNAEIGRYWLIKAANAGSSIAMNNLGVSYVFGSHGLEASPEMAVEWLCRAIAAGHETAERALFEVVLMFPELLKPPGGPEITIGDLYGIVQIRSL